MAPPRSHSASYVLRLVALTLIPLAHALGQQAPRFYAAAFRLVDSIAEAEFAKDSLGSITVGVVDGSGLSWSKSYGFLDRARHQPATPATVYRIASVTKQFTALMLLQLRERNLVRYRDPVEKFFPEIRRVQGWNA